ncbi:MAG: DUF2971 domain-containing protein [Proteobacteria bacterium]|nr:DUF2971 domain-containing protein [Pseudomonadota bacterium]
MWIDEFLKLMAGSTVTPDTINAAYELKEKNFPSKIYKFRAINDHAISNFKNDTVWLCSADKFNDPYECAAKCDTEEVTRQFSKNNLDEWFSQTDFEKNLSSIEVAAVKASSDPMKELSKILIGTHEGISGEEKEKIISELSAIERKLSLEIFSRFNRSMQRRVKICSFSSRVDSVVMWGHYADSHKGFAIEYDVTNWPQGDLHRQILYPVIYKQDIFDSTKFHLQNALGKDVNNRHFCIVSSIRKSPDWSYESEWRFVLPVNQFYLDMDYLMPKPSAVYIGAKIESINKTRLLEIAKRKKMPIYQMSLSMSEYKFNYHDVMEL